MNIVVAPRRSTVTGAAILFGAIALAALALIALVWFLQRARERPTRRAAPTVS